MEQRQSHRDQVRGFVYDSSELSPVEDGKAALQIEREPESVARLRSSVARHFPGPFEAGHSNP
ncbi:hypothetical protein V9K92_00215 [Phyllobacterium sp. CCNWLW109]|uniref:hypothetical protein n=1 Tax=Phyllobacterium sp. CCNWLW109 TaxID=3127479 RepID=UPI0030778E5C